MLGGPPVFGILFSMVMRLPSSSACIIDSKILSAFDVLSQCAIEWCVVFIFFRIELMTSFRSCLCVVSCTIFCIASPGYRLNQHVRDVAAPFHVQH
jgi:hypothetical protein